MSAGQNFANRAWSCWIVGAVAESRDVVGQRVEPDVDDVLFVAGNWNAPAETAAADGEIFEPAAHERDDLAARRLRLHEAGILFVELEQLAFKCGELEKVILFADGFSDATAIGAGRARWHIDPRLIGHAVLASVRAFVDESAIAESGEKLLHSTLVAGLGGADEVVVGEAEPIPEGTEFGSDFVGEKLWREPGEFGGSLDLLAMLVGSGEEPGIDAHGTLAACDCVAHDGRVSVAQVWTRIYVVDGRGEVKPGWVWVLVRHWRAVAFGARVGLKRNDVRLCASFILGCRIGCVKRKGDSSSVRIALKIKHFKGADPCIRN